MTSARRQKSVGPRRGPFLACGRGSGGKVARQVVLVMASRARMSRDLLRIVGG